MLNIIKSLDRTYSGTVWTNKKNKARYYIENIALECTNNRENNIVVVYSNVESYMFCRDYDEFIEKFERIY